MRSRPIALIMMLAAVGLPAFAGAEEINPFRIARDEFVARIKIVALRPVALPQDAGDPETAKPKFESMISTRLQAAGLQVLAPQVFSDIWKHMNEVVGGYFDPLTGKPDQEKLKAIVEHTRRELAAKHNADAIVFASVRPFSIPFAGGKAKWHGTSQEIQSFGEMFFRGASRGTVGALSLVVGIEDINGVDLYTTVAGIQLLSKVDGRKFVPIGRDQLLADDKRNAAAVDMALGPLTTPPKSDATSSR